MTLASWAESLLDAPGSASVVSLHVGDTAAAFFAGARTREGRELAHFYATDGDLAKRAAAAAAIARSSECDDIHLASCVTPGAVVIPVALALAQNCSREAFEHAIAAGYGAGLHIGVAIGGLQTFAAGVWPTRFAAPVMAAVTTACLKGLSASKLAHSIAPAPPGTNGRIGRPKPPGRVLRL